MRPVATSEERFDAGLGSPIARHHYTVPVVRELEAPVPRRRRTQRDLVVASLVVCDREDRPVHRRWA